MACSTSAAGVVVAAAEVLPGLKHFEAEWAVALGGGVGIVLMLAIRWLDERMQGTTGLLAEAHQQPDTPLATALFFVGFLGLLILDGLA